MIFSPQKKEIICAFALILQVLLASFFDKPLASVGIEGGPIFSLTPLEDHRNLDPVFLGTGTGIYQRNCCLDIWRPSNDGLPSLCVYDIACFSDTLPNTIYAGTRQGAAKSSDNGTTWESIGLSVPVNTIIVHPVTKTYLVAGTPEGVYISKDGGDNWDKKKSCVQAVYALAIDPKNPQTIYAASFGDDIYKSTDFGEIWKTTCCGPKNVTKIIINPQNTNILYAATDSGIYKSTDAGLNWKEINADFTGTSIHGLAINKTDPAILYAATDKGVYKTTNDGTAWSVINNGIHCQSSQGPFARAIALHPVNQSLLYAGIYSGIGDDVDIYESTDAGTSWKQINRKLSNSSVYAIDFDHQYQQFLYAGTSKLAVMRSTDGGFGWKEANDGFTNYCAYTIMSHPDVSARVFAGTANGLFVSSDNGITWMSACCPNSSIFCIAVNPFNTNELYCGTDNGIFSTSDTGETWTSLSTNLASPFVRTIVFSPVEEGEMYAGTSDDGIFKSVSSGSTWEQSNNGIVHKEILSLAISPQEPYEVFAGTRGGGVYRSTDSGLSWEQISALDGFTINSIAINPFNDSFLYIGTEGKGFYSSTDDGLTWSVGDEALKEKTIYTVKLNPYDPQTLFVGLDGEIKSYNYNTPPFAPSEPLPEAGAKNQSLIVTLSWQGGDPDPGDTLTYKVFFGTTADFGDNATATVTTTSYTPPALALNTTYYWKVIAVDSKNEKAESDIWSFTTIVSNPPDKPSSPSPADGAKDQPFFLALSWTGSDPDDNDTLSYDVYFGVTPKPLLVRINQSESTFTPVEPLLPMTTYYWKVVARDSHGRTTAGDVWSFTTRRPFSECLAERVVGDDMGALALLRRFRDEVLQTTQPGRELAGLYYALSPSLLAILDRHPERIAALRAEYRRCRPALEAMVSEKRADFKKIAAEGRRLLQTHFPEHRPERTP